MALFASKESDRRITAFTRSRIDKDFGDGTVWLCVQQYNCWGKKIGGELCHRTTKEIANKSTGQRDVRSLKLTHDGCCPPQLTKDFVMQEGGEMVERDPVEEAMKLHKRGYFGGGG